jgi:hypothetical protein
VIDTSVVVTSMASVAVKKDSLDGETSVVDSVLALSFSVAWTNVSD